MVQEPAAAPADDAAHLLIVDDDTRIRELLDRYLKDQGFRVSTAADAAEARRKLEGIDFDLLVLDVMMPGESGLALTSTLRQIKSVPILLLTALSESTDRIKGLEAGADDYLPKPFDPRELVLRINNILKRGGPPATPKMTKAEYVAERRRERWDVEMGQIPRAWRVLWHARGGQ